MAKPPDLVGLNSAYGRYDTLTAEQKAEHGTGVVYQTLDEIMVEIRNLMANKNTRGQANTLRGWPRKLIPIPSQLCDSSTANSQKSRLQN